MYEGLNSQQGAPRAHFFTQANPVCTAQQLSVSYYTLCAARQRPTEGALVFFLCLRGFFVFKFFLLLMLVTMQYLISF